MNLSFAPTDGLEPAFQVLDVTAEGAKCKHTACDNRCRKNGNHRTKPDSHDEVLGNRHPNENYE